jgi:four helix bundle protein
MNKYDLEDRLIDFAVSVMKISDQLPKTDAGCYLAGQLVRSGTAPALIYGEAQSAESRKDFIHKMKLSLKELRETSVNLKIIVKRSLYSSKDNIQPVLKESNELISIFVKSIQTARDNEHRTLN